MTTILLMLLFLIQTPPITINVTVETVDGTPASGLRVRFSDETNSITGDCTTEADGRCTIFLDVDLAPDDTVRGALYVGQNARRSLIFSGDDKELTLTLQIDRRGAVVVPGHEPLPTPEAFSSTLEVLPTAYPATAETESPYVVFEPNEALVEEPPATIVMIPASADAGEEGEAGETVETAVPLSEAPARQAIVEGREASLLLPILIGIIGALLLAVVILAVALVWRKRNA